MTAAVQIFLGLFTFLNYELPSSPSDKHNGCTVTEWLTLLPHSRLQVQILDCVEFACFSSMSWWVSLGAPVSPVTHKYAL